MNIFATSPDPAEAAKYLDDSRVLKCAHETVLIATNVVTLHGGPQLSALQEPNACIGWANASLKNYCWLIDYGLHLFREHYQRTGAIHKSANVLMFCAAWIAERKCLPDVQEPLKFVNMTNPLNTQDVHEFYRRDLQSRWRQQAEHSRTPKWYSKEDGSRYE